MVDSPFILIRSYLKGEIMKSATRILIAASVLFGSLCLAGHSDERDSTVPARVTPVPVRAAPGTVRATPARPAPVRMKPVPVRIRPAKEPHEESVILVEAFMAEVRLSALRSLGVPQISKGSEAVSADHVIKLLKDTNNAQITAGAKLSVCPDTKATSESTVRQGISTGTSEEKKTEYVEVGTSFTVQAYIESEERIRLNLDFQHSGVRQSNTDDVFFPPLITMNWSLSVFLDDGKPTIVGAAQDVQTAAFLIVTASIKD
jgi:hypothetical protein